MNIGFDKRTIKETVANAFSSRSHLISQIKIIMKDKKTKKNIVGKITLVDLAGSERVARIGTVSASLVEGMMINEGLQCLGYIIKKLNSLPNSQIVKHELYNVHLLTQLLRDSFGGNSRALMIVNISPSVWDIPQTKLTVEFAIMTGLVKNRAGQLQLKSELELALESMYYIEFLPEGQPRPHYVEDWPSKPEHNVLLEKLKDHTVTGY